MEGLSTLGIQLLLVTCRNRGKEGMKGKYLVIQHLFGVYHPYGIDRRKNKDLVSIFCKFKLLEIKKMGPCVVLFLVYLKIAPMISSLGRGGLRDGNGSGDKNVGDTILDCDALFLKRKGLKHMTKKRSKKKRPRRFSWTQMKGIQAGRIVSATGQGGPHR